MSKLHSIQEELQQIEHLNKVLREQKELANVVTKEVKVDLDNHIRILRDYANALSTIQHSMGESIKNIYKSAQEVRRATSSAQEILTFCQAVMKLEATLNNPDVQKALQMVNRNG